MDDGLLFTNIHPSRWRNVKAQITQRGFWGNQRRLGWFGFAARCEEAGSALPPSSSCNTGALPSSRGVRGVALKFREARHGRAEPQPHIERHSRYEKVCSTENKKLNLCLAARLLPQSKEAKAGSALPPDVRKPAPPFRQAPPLIPLRRGNSLSVRLLGSPAVSVAPAPL